MDEYFILIRHDKIPSKIVDETIQVLRNKRSRWNSQLFENQQLVNVSNILCSRKKKIFACHLVVNDNEEAGNFSWSDVKDDTSDVGVTKGSYSSLAELLMAHSDELPLPGSCTITAVLFLQSDGWNSMDDVKNTIPLLGCLQKLHLWHNAKFTLVCDTKNKHVQNIVDFVSRNSHISSQTEYKNNVLSEILQEHIWNGSLKMFSEGECICKVSNMQLTLPGKEESSNPDVANEENEDCHLWFQNSITVIELIDFNSVPFYLFSGKNFNLTTASNFEDVETLNHIIDNLSQITDSCLFCSIDYAMMPTPFPSTSTISYAEWKDCVSNDPENLDVRFIKPECATNVLHFVLVLNFNSKTLIARLLHPLDTFYQTMFASTDLKTMFPESNDFSANQPDDCIAYTALKNLSVIDSRNNKASSASEAVRKKEIGMFFRCQDVLKSFSKSGKPKGKCPYISQPSPHETPDKTKLRDFKYALNNTHHGISFNQDGKNSEYKDRESRRLINQFVKFETASIASVDKISLPSLFVEDSPGKQKISARRSSDIKQKKLEEVAEKLYRKRLQSRSRSSSNMVLRSTPKKEAQRRDTLREIKTTQNHVISKTAAKKSLQDRHRNNKQLLQNIITKTLLQHGVDDKHPKYAKCCKKLYDVSMMFLKDLKSCKGLDVIINKTVDENVNAVLVFFNIKTKS